MVGAQINQELATRSISSNRAGHLPTLALATYVNRSSNSPVPVQQQPAFTKTSKNIGIRLNIPIFSEFAVTSKVREASALEGKAGNDFEAAKRGATTG